MTIRPDHDLGPAAIAALEGLLLSEPSSAPTSEADLLSLLRGDLPPLERERVAAAILRSVTLRRQLVELYRAAEHLRRVPVELWGEAFREALYLVPAREALSAAQSVEALEWPLVVGSDERRFVALRRALGTIADSARLALSAPRFASVRSGKPHGDAKLAAAITGHGELEAEAAEMEMGAQGRSATLELVDPLGGGFPIAASTSRAGRWRFRAEGFGALTGFPEGPLPNSLFRLRIEDEEPGSREPGSLWAEDDEGGLVAIELVHPPRVSSGELTLVLRVPQEARDAYSRARLAVSLLVARQEALLGSWSVSEMPHVAALSARVFDLPEGDVPFGSFLKARLADGPGA